MCRSVCALLRHVGPLTPACFAPLLQQSQRKGIPLPPHPEGRHGGAEPGEPAMLSGITKALTSTRPSSLAQPSLVPHASALSCAASIHGTLPHACPPLLSSLACGASSDCLILERACPNTNLYHSVGSTRSCNSNQTLDLASPKLLVRSSNRDMRYHRFPERWSKVLHTSRGGQPWSHQLLNPWPEPAPHLQDALLQPLHVLDNVMLRACRRHRASSEKRRALQRPQPTVMQ